MVNKFLSSIEAWLCDTVQCIVQMTSLITVFLSFSLVFCTLGTAFGNFFNPRRDDLLLGTFDPCTAREKLSEASQVAGFFSLSLCFGLEIPQIKTLVSHTCFGTPQSGCLSRRHTVRAWEAVIQRISKFFLFPPGRPTLNQEIRLIGWKPYRSIIFGSFVDDEGGWGSGGL